MTPPLTALPPHGNEFEMNLLSSILVCLILEVTKLVEAT